MKPMNLTLYPLVSTKIHAKEIKDSIKKLWQSHPPLPEVYYGVYYHYQSDYKGDFDFVIATEQATQNEFSPIEIEDLILHEKFITNRENLAQTWQHIQQRTQQGFLKRAYKVDFEKYSPNGKIEIYISIMPFC